MRFQIYSTLHVALTLRLTLAGIVNPITEEQCSECCETLVGGNDLQICIVGCTNFDFECETEECEVGRDMRALGFAKNPNNDEQAFICNPDGEVQTVEELTANTFPNIEDDLPPINQVECNTCCDAVNDDVELADQNIFNRAACEDTCADEINGNINLLPICFNRLNNNGVNTVERRYGCFVSADFQSNGASFFVFEDNIDQELFCFQNQLLLENPIEDDDDDLDAVLLFIIGGAGGAVIVLAVLSMVLFAGRMRKKKNDDYDIKVIGPSSQVGRSKRSKRGRHALSGLAPSPGEHTEDIAMTRARTVNKENLGALSQFENLIHGDPVIRTSSDAFYSKKRKGAISPAESI